YPETGRHQRDQRKGIVAGIGNIARQIMLLELLGKVPLRIGEVLPPEANNLLIPQIRDRHLVEISQRAVPSHHQHIALMGNGDETKRADVLDRADEAEIDAAAFELA